MRIISNLPYFFFAFALLFACNDPSVVGLDLVEDNQIDIIFSEDIPFSLTTVEGEPVPTYTINDATIIAPSSYLCGRLDHPTFGISEASIFSELALNLIKPITNVPNLQIDSAFLVLPYDTTAFYGDTTELVTVEVYEILEQLEPTETYFHNTPIATSEVSIGKLDFVPNPSINSELVTYLNNRADTVMSSDLRIPLDLAFGQRLIDQDSTIFDNDTTFTQFLNGLNIRISNTERSMLSFDLAPDNAGFRAGLYLYYDTLNTPGAPIEYYFPFTPLSRFNAVKFTQFQHDYTNTPIANSIEENSNSEERIYVQGMGGVNGKLTFPTLNELGDIVVNQAKIELVIISEGDSNQDRFPPAEQILLFEKNSEGALELVSDFEVAARAVGNPRLAFGGDLQNASIDSTQQSYTIFFSNHFQEIINGEAANEIFIQASPTASLIFIDTQASTKADRANWSILGSENNKEERFRARFSLAYTRLD
ncbi:MAG: DUF4270 family protein [Bacteroidota bacterium]